MHTLFVLLVTLCFTWVALARYDVDVTSADGTRTFRFSAAWDNIRPCWCLKNSPTSIIQGVNGGLIRVFQTDNCSGPFNYTLTNGRLPNTLKAMSFSMGNPNISSTSSEDHCPNWYST